jgi:hypothetical protein
VTNTDAQHSSCVVLAILWVTFFSTNSKGRCQKECTGLLAACRRCCAAVHHCGVGTCGAVLRAGALAQGTGLHPTQQSMVYMRCTMRIHICIGPYVSKACIQTRIWPGCAVMLCPGDGLPSHAVKYRQHSMQSKKAASPDPCIQCCVRAAGIPSVPCPVMLDQPFQAARLVEAGVACKALPFHQISAAVSTPSQSNTVSGRFCCFVRFQDSNCTCAAT